MGDTGMSRCNLCLQHAYEEPSPKMTNLMKGANFDPTGTNPFVVDAYLMFQDIVMLVGADQPVWMIGILPCSGSITILVFTRTGTISLRAMHNSCFSCEERGGDS